MSSSDENLHHHEGKHSKGTGLLYILLCHARFTVSLTEVTISDNKDPKVYTSDCSAIIDVGIYSTYEGTDADDLIKHMCERPSRLNTTPRESATDHPDTYAKYQDAFIVHLPCIYCTPPPRKGITTTINNLCHVSGIEVNCTPTVLEIHESSKPGKGPLVLNGGLGRSNVDGISDFLYGAEMRTISCTVYAHVTGVTSGHLGVGESVDVVSKGPIGTSYDDEYGGRHL